ncbi:Hypothetical protein AA314_07192 [Archangium gephyra]|uniref:Uncharacterized protein n=1 Tax=Archangium gephyra TaxID=48 RepID=A0AAC8TIG2_9BACT|nr:Hypothetical protein AA314_07192 [Archangium gephyra]
MVHQRGAAPPAATQLRVTRCIRALLRLQRHCSSHLSPVRNRRGEAMALESWTRDRF